MKDFLYPVNDISGSNAPSLALKIWEYTKGHDGVDQEEVGLPPAALDLAVIGAGCCRSW